jgi:hypothetical protein
LWKVESVGASCFFCIHRKNAASGVFSPKEERFWLPDTLNVSVEGDLKIAWKEA